MKKDKDWAKFKIREELHRWWGVEGGIDEDGIKYVLNIIDQLDEPLYHALIKGHELVDSYDIYWNVDRSDYGVFVSRLHPPHDNFITEMSKEAWNELGIDESNAEFVKVDAELN